MRRHRSNGLVLDLVTKKLLQFVASLPGPIRDVTADSRRVNPGSIFIAVPGGTLDGHSFIPQATQNGAIAIVGERSSPDPASSSVPYLAVPDARRALAALSAHLHDYPSRQMIMIGITGTDGKTTTANLLHHILTAAGLRSGLISTINAVLGQHVADTGLHVTTPDAPAMQAFLAEMVSADLTHCILEATSHGLAQHRIAACDFDVAVITNITHEHLDYHGDYQAYRAAKAMLFENLSTAARKPGQPKTAILNVDDTSFEYLRAIPVDRQYCYSRSGPADLTARNLHSVPGGTAFDLVTDNGVFPIRTHLVGKHNVCNVLAAAGAALALGLPVDAIQRGCANLPGVPGRMERIDAGQPFTLIVDFAHTPNALQSVIEAGREMARPHGRVITVFGSAGLRDAAKRHLMARASARHADLTVLTAEDPRTESLGAILAAMASGCRSEGSLEGETFFCVPDRMRAIHFALTQARPGDVVLVCGKGHEQSMCFGETEFPWDDRQAARRALLALAAHQPPPDSGLPTSDEQALVKK